MTTTEFDDKIEELENTDNAAEALTKMTDYAAKEIVKEHGRGDHVDYAALHHYAAMDTSYDDTIDAHFTRNLIDSPYMDIVLDARIGEDDGGYDNRDKTIVAEARTGLRVVYISTPQVSQAHVDVPDNLVYDWIAADVKNRQNPSVPDKCKNVEVKVNHMAIDVPRFDD